MITNPNSATQRIKNHLSYKLGQELIKYNTGGVISLLFKLYHIKKTHHKLTQFRKTLELARADLAYPPLRQCFDFNEALWVKTHLSYRLGKILLNKASYFNLYGKIKQAKKEFKALKESRVYRLKDKLKFKNEEDFDFFIKNYALIENLLTHYEALNEVIVLNMAFVLEHFDEVSLWLNSKEFKEKYENINHPYPPLLNPDVLNELLNLEDEQDKETLRIKLKELSNTQHTNALSDTIKAYAKAGLDYRLIPAEKAWEMNLPLPRRYEFVGFLLHTNGEKAFSKFLTELQIELIFSFGYNAKLRYEHYFKILSNNQSKKALIFLDQYMDLNEKFCLLMQDAPLLVLVRDPLDALRSFLNVRTSLNGEKIWTLRYDDLLKINNMIVYVHDEKACYNPNSSQKYPLIDGISQFINSTHWMLDFSLNRNRILKYYENNMYFIDMYEIVGQNCYETLKKIAQDFHLKIPEKSLIFEQQLYSILTMLLPCVMEFDDDIKVFISNYYSYKILPNPPKKHILNSQLSHIFDDNIFIFLEQNDYYKIKNTHIYDEILKHIDHFLLILKQVIEDEKCKEIKILDVLQYFKVKPKQAKIYKEILDKELIFIKKERPDIVASWKYYKEFEKMCEDFENQN